MTISLAFAKPQHFLVALFVSDFISKLYMLNLTHDVKQLYMRKQCII